MCLKYSNIYLFENRKNTPLAKRVMLACVIS